MVIAVCYDVGVWKHVNARSGREFVKHVVPAVLKPARTLWNEIIGFVFICFAVTFGYKAVRLYLDFLRGALVRRISSSTFDRLLALVSGLCLTACELLCA